MVVESSRVGIDLRFVRGFVVHVGDGVRVVFQTVLDLVVLFVKHNELRVAAMGVFDLGSVDRVPL